MPGQLEFVSLSRHSPLHKLVLVSPALPALRVMMMVLQVPLEPRMVVMALVSFFSLFDLGYEHFFSVYIARYRGCFPFFLLSWGPRLTTFCCLASLHVPYAIDFGFFLVFVLGSASHRALF